MPQALRSPRSPFPARFRLAADLPRIPAHLEKDFIPQGLSSKTSFTLPRIKRSRTLRFCSIPPCESSQRIWPEPLVFETNRSYWARSQPPQNPSLTDDIAADVAVLGGGFTGLSTAYYIRRISPRKRVVVLEAKGCGNGASGRNGAMVLTMTADRYMHFSSAPAIDKKIYDLTAQNIRELSKLSVATGIDCELETNGALQMLVTSEDVRAAKAYVQEAQSLGMPVEFWDKQRLVGAIGTEVYEGGFFDPNGGHIHPMKLVHVFKAAAEST